MTVCWLLNEASKSFLACWVCQEKQEKHKKKLYLHMQTLFYSSCEAKYVHLVLINHSINILSKALLLLLLLLF